MKKINSIRLFFLVGALACCTSYGIGYYQSVQQTKEKYWEKEDTTKILPEAAESSAIISPYEFILSELDEYVIVYYADGETIYSTTDIKVENLPVKIQSEIREGKKIATERELYNFLENYSS